MNASGPVPAAASETTAKAAKPLTASRITASKSSTGLGSAAPSYGTVWIDAVRHDTVARLIVIQPDGRCNQYTLGADAADLLSAKLGKQP